MNLLSIGLSVRKGDFFNSKQLNGGFSSLNTATYRRGLLSFFLLFEKVITVLSSEKGHTHPGLTHRSGSAVPQKDACPFFYSPFGAGHDQRGDRDPEELWRKLALSHIPVFG